tara:strand:+ start:309 stop:560 length:252 start_codon:yes stop_codon:yes gene_type:complete
MEDFIPWNSANDKSEEAFWQALDKRSLDGSTCLICQRGLEMNGLICLDCEDKYSWSKGEKGEGFYLNSTLSKAFTTGWSILKR